MHLVGLWSLHRSYRLKYGAPLAAAVCLFDSGKSGLKPEHGRNVIGLANQISQSMAVEVKVLNLKMQMGQSVDKFGTLKID